MKKSFIKQGFTLVEIMIVVAIIALLAALALPGLLRSRINANEAAAKANLKAIATACESYAAANDGNYPTNKTDLTNVNPPYLTRDIIGQTVQGYKYDCTFTNTSYNCTATPAHINVTGKKTFRITTGGNLTEVP